MTIPQVIVLATLLGVVVIFAPLSEFDFWLVTIVGFSAIIFAARYQAVNKLGPLRQEVELSHSAISSALRKRVDLLNRLIATVLHLESHQRETANAAGRAMSDIVRTINATNAVTVLIALSRDMLKTGDPLPTRDLLAQLTRVEDEYHRAIETHNQCVLRYNNAAHAFRWLPLPSSAPSGFVYVDAGMADQILPTSLDPANLRFVTGPS